MSVRLTTWIMKLNPMGERVGAAIRIPDYDDGVSVSRLLREIHVQSIEKVQIQRRAGPEPQRLKCHLTITLLHPPDTLIQNTAPYA